MTYSGKVRRPRRYEEPIGVALETASPGDELRVRLDGSRPGWASIFIAADDILANEFVALDAGFWTWLIGGARQALAARLHRIAQRLDYRP